MAQQFTMKQAAQVCGVSRDTIKRRVVSGAFPSAAKDAAGQWLIPVEDLLAAGLHPGKPAGPDIEVAEDLDVIDLREQLAVAKSELAGAERVKRAEIEAVTARAEGLEGQMKAIEASKQEQAALFEVMQKDVKASANSWVESERQAAQEQVSTWKQIGIGGGVLSVMLFVLLLVAVIYR